jgi:hypothetical protein
MTTGVTLQLHLLGDSHSHEHDFDNCQVCQQLLLAPGKFTDEPQISVPDIDPHCDSFEFATEFCITAFHGKPFNARPPPFLLSI